MPEICENMLKYLDKAAYNRPDMVPSCIQRNDHTQYRIYFRFMCCAYLLYKNGILDTDALGKIKKAFINDFMIYDILFKAMAKSEREFRKINAALIDCRKNADNCSFCKSVSEIRGSVTKQNEPDIEVDNGI